MDFTFEDVLSDIRASPPSKKADDVVVLRRAAELIPSFIAASITEVGPIMQALEEEFGDGARDSRSKVAILLKEAQSLARPSQSYRPRERSMLSDSDSEMLPQKKKGRALTSKTTASDLPYDIEDEETSGEASMVEDSSADLDIGDDESNSDESYSSREKKQGRKKKVVSKKSPGPTSKVGNLKNMKPAGPAPTISKKGSAPPKRPPLSSSTSSTGVVAEKSTVSHEVATTESSPDKVRGSVAKLHSSLPLVLPRRSLQGGNSTVLVQLEDSKLELEGDVGAIGRLTVLPNEGLILDLKGVQFAGTIVPSCSVMVVGFSGVEARVESVVSDFVQVEHLSNVLESLGGAMTSGLLDPSLLEFEDCGCSEAGVEHLGVDAEGGESCNDENTGTDGKGKRRGVGGKKRGREGAETQGVGEGVSVKGKGRGMKAAIKGMMGRKVSVGKKKKGKRKTGGK